MNQERRWQGGADIGQKHNESNMKFSKHFLLLCAASMLPVSTAHASTVRAAGDPTLVSMADVVAVGNVIDTETVILPGGVVVTHARVQLSDVLKGGQNGQVVKLQVPGGALGGGMVAETAGAPKLRAGERVLGFLKKHGATYRPLGMSLGLLRVRRANDGTWRVSRELDGLTLLGPRGEHVAPGVVEVQSVPLTDYLAQLQTYLQPIGPQTNPGTVVP